MTAHCEKKADSPDSPSIIKAARDLLPAIAQPASEANISPSVVNPEALKHWQDDRFGMFIHWGPVSQIKKEIGWSRGHRDVTNEEYDTLYKTFNPVEFDADAWVKIAQSAGMKYIVLVTKHHGGFSMWDTKVSNYNIMHTPFQRDVVKELSEACQRAGMDFGCYYSVLDWWHPDFPLTGRGGNFKRKHSDLDAYTRYMKMQLKELLTNYGPLITIWFDMPQCFDAKRGQGVIDLVRSIQPNILVNDRSGATGDYDTPEQKIGKLDRKRPWESCMTVSAHNHWAWHGKGDGVKPLSELVKALIACAGGDGNMLLNVGPRADGMIDEEQAGRLKEMGDWLAKYGESIYGTRGGPYKPGEWGASTCKGNTIYLSIFRFDENNSILLPPINQKIVRSQLLSGGKLAVKQDGNGVVVTVAPSDQGKIATVVKLELAGSAFNITPVAVSP